MNIMLWIVQAILALLCVSGGAYKVTSAHALASQFPALPGVGWRSLGVVEVVLGILLIVPAAFRILPALTPIAAAVLAVESLALAALYARTSLQVTGSNPMVWAAGMGVLASFAAYGRFALTSS